MVSGAPEQSDRVALVQRLLRYYAEVSSDTASDRDIVSEHMGHLCVSYSMVICYLSQVFLQRRWMRYDFDNSLVPLLGTQPPC
jgi:hypothetical protein